MITKRPAVERGRTQWSWLDSHHTFSFGDYYDPRHERHGALRVLNDDLIAPGGGFEMHPHRNAEIFTYVLSGSLRHQDSLGNSSVISAGNMQYMSAGAGIRHSEFNASADQPLHLLQIWMLPEEPGGEPRYAEHPLRTEDFTDGTLRVFSGTGIEDSIAIRQDAEVWLVRLQAGAEKTLSLPRSKSWIHFIKGNIFVAEESFTPGDGAGLVDEKSVTLLAREDSEFLLFNTH